MSENTLPKGYEPWEVEERWAKHWEEAKTFTPDANAPGEPYSIVIPPPNVTGALHMGHALNLTLQDILCRFHRQLGKNVLWVPGTDHAGIATQNVVERALKSEGKTRHDLGREKFIERVWEWRKDYGSRILNQIRRMGASVDWTRERFTLDEGLSKAVRGVFVRLFEEGLIYKGDYIVNWCNRCHTALADDEVEYSPRKGAIYKIKYPLSDGSGFLTVATTRPETMLGDTAVAVHPEDERYYLLVGKSVTLPLVGREMPIIADKYVDKEFGTGCLKVTPAHDMNDYELGRKHRLEVIQVIDAEGRMNQNAPEKYRGLAKEECRSVVVEDLKALGLLEDVTDHDHNVGECYRCKSVIEPHVSTQWFVAVKPLAEKARAAVPGATQIFPDNWVKVYYDWLDNIRDWCISRQIWWGHRIPAWTCAACGKLIVAREDPTSCPHCQSTDLSQEEDVLDTWFSSALWPFSTLGWPEKTKDLETWYPTSVLVTGFDILFFWVARMMMMGLHFKEEVPFRHVYIHALVRDESGRKMSKSTGNVIDPLEMIKLYGTDSLRFTLAAFAAMGRDIRLSEKRIEGNRHFVNKIWNAARFALMNLPDCVPEADLAQAEDLADRWILHRLQELKAEVKQATLDYRFNDAAQGLYRFIWGEFCDWYLEMIKPRMQSGDEAKKAVTQRCLFTVLSETMLLLHPIMPFVTQEIWTHLPGLAGTDIAVQPFPEAVEALKDPEAARRMELFQGVVAAVRNIRSELLIDPAKRLSLLVRTVSGDDQAVIDENAGLIVFLARLEKVEAGPDVKGPRASGTAVVAGNELFVPLEGIVDFDAELARLDKELGKLDKELGAVTRKLANEGFTAKAPAEVVEKEREKARDWAEKMEKLKALRARFESAKG
jgi:valyl-tRNA synthetase